LNLTTENLAKQTDWCGVKSGKDVNKFKEMSLTPEKAPNISAPMIKESPLCIECKVIEVKELGTHDMFIANVVGVHADERYINKESGLFDLQSAKLMTYSHGKYYSIGEQLGFFGFSVQKKKKK
jgi:flavin reductase (DIM6/NTAB) family NADH-FMN oxidoreductase RutF